VLNLGGSGNGVRGFLAGTAVFRVVYTHLVSGIPTTETLDTRLATDLTIPGFPGTFAVGDVANIPGPDGHPLPQLGSVAQQSGKWAAGNILADLAGVADVIDGALRA